MNVLITGGAGFIGSHLADRCLAERWAVSVLDDLSTGVLDNVRHLVGHPHFSFVQDSIFHEARVDELVEHADLVFHLAAAVGVKLILQKPVQAMETNLRGTETVLRCAARRRKPLVFTSTSEVYGKSTRLPFREDDDLVLGPTHVARWNYANSKAMDERMALSYCREGGLPFVVVRLFNTVGPRQRDTHGMVLPTFVRQALREQPITVHGTGEQRRCFGYVNEVVEALVRIAQTPRAVGQVINIGNDQEISVNRLAHMVKQITGARSPVVHLSYDQAYGPGFEDMPRRVPCLEKLESLVHFRPTTPLETIVRRVVIHEWAKMPQHAMAAAV